MTVAERIAHYRDNVFVGTMTHDEVIAWIPPVTDNREDDMVEILNVICGKTASSARLTLARQLGTPEEIIMYFIANFIDMTVDQRVTLRNEWKAFWSGTDLRIYAEDPNMDSIVSRIHTRFDYHG